MRSSFIRLAILGGCVAAVLSCDAGPITPVFRTSLTFLLAGEAWP